MKRGKIFESLNLRYIIVRGLFMFDDAAVVHEMNEKLVNMHKNAHDMKAF